MPKGTQNKRYTPEFKIKVVETMQKENLSYKEAAREFDVSFDTVVAKWKESIWKKERKGSMLNEEDESQQDVLQN